MVEAIKSCRHIKSNSLGQSTVHVLLNLHNSPEPHLQTGPDHSYNLHLDSDTCFVFFIDVGSSFQILAPWYQNDFKPFRVVLPLVIVIWFRLMCYMAGGNVKHISDTAQTALMWAFTNLKADWFRPWYIHGCSGYMIRRTLIIRNNIQGFFCTLSILRLFVCPLNAILYYSNWSYKSHIHGDFTLRAHVFYNSSQCISLMSGTYTQFGFIFIKEQLVINEYK